jgi:hypothetical protein
MSFVFQEIPAEALRHYIEIITGNNAVLMTVGNRKLFHSTVASCRYVSELTFKPIAVCFLRPQRNSIRMIEKNESFSLSYFPPQYQQLFGSEPCVGTLEPEVTTLGNVYYPQAEWIFECRKVHSLELILSREIQAILAAEKNRSIYPGGETPRMFVGEIINGWHKILTHLANENMARLLPETNRNKFLASGRK